MPIFSITIAAIVAQQVPSASIADDSIVVTGAREPVLLDQAPLSVTIFDEAELEALGLPLTGDILRLAPGVSVASTGPKGTQAQLRIRGAEANHTLLFVDGIRFNDPAAGNEARFELLTNDALSRIEVVRGPQSALWGSEALGGVVAVETADPLRRAGFGAQGEYGSFDSARASAQGAVRLGEIGLSAAGGWMRSDGIDSFGAGGDRDGFKNRSATIKAAYEPVEAGELGIVAHWIDTHSDYDGFDPMTFRRADTLDSTDNRVAAVRGWGALERSGWSISADASLLDSANRNRLAGAPLNSTFGKRLALGGQSSRRVGDHELIGAIEHEAEDFRAEDENFSGLSDQRRSRDLTALVGEWRAEWSPALTTDLALRHDDFSDFADATSFRASALLRPLAHWTFHLAYGEGIAQPSFYDLYGFFPGSFVGNPDLKPETSKGWEAGLRWVSSGTSIGITGFSNRLEDEIVDVFDSTTFLSSTANVHGKSRRRGIEIHAAQRLPGLGELALNYSYLDAQERQAVGADAIREVRRPRHGANAMLTGSSGRFDWGTSLAYVGKRFDTDFDLFPAERVTLGDYALASAKLSYRLSPMVEAYARVENAFDARYQDVVGYNTPGRAVYAGIRLHLGD